MDELEECLKRVEKKLIMSPLTDKLEKVRELLADLLKLEKEPVKKLVKTIENIAA